MTLGLPIVGLQGVWNWRTKQGGETLSYNSSAASAVSPDLDELPLDGRTVFVVFDSDIVDKQQVAQAVNRLSGVLRKRGAQVRVMRLPDAADGSKQGLDDYVATGGVISDALVDVGLTQGADDGDGEDVADALRRLALDRYEIGRAANFGPYVVEQDGPNVALPLDHTFKAVLAALWADEHDDTPGTFSVNAAHLVLQGMAQAQPEGEPLPVRVATTDDGASVIDLADADGRAVVIRDGEWRIVDRSPVLFRRGGSMKALPVPEAGGDPFELLSPFVRAEDDDTRQLAIAWAGSLAFEWMVHPIVYVSGPSGSGKTQTALWLKSALDPSAAAFQRFQNERDNLVAASSTWSFMYDNLGDGEERNTPFWDFVAGLVTGTGYTTRALYTNMDTVSVNLRRCVLMTSVEELELPEDAAERCIHWDVPSLRGGGRMSLGAMEQQYRQLHPRIFGALLDLVAEASERMDVFNMTGLEGLRFTDFGAYLRAVDEVRGTNTLQAYKDTLEATVADRAAVSPLVHAIVQLVNASGGEWEGEARELLQGLSAIAATTGQGGASLPDTARALGKQLAREDATLRMEGIHHVKRRTNGRRVTRLERIDGGPGGGAGPNSDVSGPNSDVSEAKVTFPDSVTSLQNPNQHKGFLGDSDVSDVKSEQKSIVVKGGVTSSHTPQGSRGKLEQNNVPNVTEDENANGDGAKHSDVTSDVKPDSDVTNGTVTLALSNDVQRVLDVLTARPIGKGALVKATGLTNTRVERSLEYLRAFGVTREAVRQQEPDLAWPKGASKGWVQVLPVNPVDRTAHNVVLFTSTMGWHGDAWQDELEASPGVNFRCDRCGDAYPADVRGWVAGCGKCRDTQ